MKRAKRVKWQAPMVLQSIHVVAGDEPNTHDRQGVAFSDILLYGLTRGDADSLAPLDCQHYHGLLRGSPVGRDFLVCILSTRVRRKKKILEKKRQETF
jgi:hypothetical protein